MLGAAGIRSAYIGIPFTYPAEPLEGIVVTGYGGPERPQILPASAEERIFAAYPDLVTAHHPMAERWWEDFPAYTGRLLEHADQMAGVCKLAFELEPDLRPLCVDFMSTDHVGHLGYARFDPDHPAHAVYRLGRRAPAGLRARRRAVRRADRRRRGAIRRGADRPPLLRSRDEADLLDVPHRPLARGARPSPLPQAVAAAVAARRGSTGSRASTRSSCGRCRGTGARSTSSRSCRGPPTDRNFADIDFGTTRAYGFASQGQLYLGELTGARNDPAYIDALAAEIAEIPHPETGEPAFEVLRKEELCTGPFLDKAPELMLLPYDERINVDPSRRRWTEAFERHEKLDPEVSYGYSGHHGVTGILAAAGPGIQPADVPDGAEIVQLPATILRLHGLSAEGLDGAPLDGLLEDASPGRGRRAARRRTKRATSPSTPRKRSARWSRSSATSATSSATGHGARLQPLKPLLYVAFQLVVIPGRHSSATCGEIHRPCTSSPGSGPTEE